MARVAWLLGVLGIVLGGASTASAQNSEEREVPASLAPFEYLIGSWKGAGVPLANRVRGWNETHQWAWKFVKGVPVGMTMAFDGDKSVTKGQLTYDEAKKQYVLEGTDPAGKPVKFTGALDKTGKRLTLEKAGKSGEVKEQLTLFPNSNQVRYTLWVAQKEADSPQFKRVMEIGVTKEGESFAAGASAANLPKCILTGGAAAMTVTYQGKSYPICCTGCRDEFNDNPEKYVKKAALRAEQEAKSPGKPAAAGRGKDDGAFEGLVDEPKKKDMPKKKAGASAKSKPADEPADDAPAGAKSDDDKNAAKAAALLKSGQNLEKSGKTAAALKYYQDIVKKYPDTPQAKTAAARIKAIGE
ncbi:MAG: YHS domain-containing protein [Isosphaeraceae bacterium]|nr:YHS domain-containing protein [Isosphaeraceae bacterium]